MTSSPRTGDESGTGRLDAADTHYGMIQESVREILAADGADRQALCGVIERLYAQHMADERFIRVIKALPFLRAIGEARERGDFIRGAQLLGAMYDSLGPLDGLVESREVIGALSGTWRAYLEEVLVKGIAKDVARSGGQAAD